jgi:CRISPR system Cascade subunit CasB
MTVTTSSTAPSTPSPPPPRMRWRLGVVGRTVDEQIGRLQSGYIKDHPSAVAALARIRGGAGRGFGELPDLWGLFELEELYEAVRGEAETVRAENAAHLAITLWSLHQQSQRSKGMHDRKGPELGTAVRLLMPGPAVDDPVRRRFVRAGSATSFEILAQRLRELVLLFRRDEVRLDYGVLAEQLMRWQQPGGQDAVRRSWGRSFHFRPPTSAAQDAPTTPTAPNAPQSPTLPPTDKDSA